MGRPALYATTRQFLDDLGVESLDQLPAMDSTPAQVAMLEQIEFGMAEPAEGTPAEQLASVEAAGSETAVLEADPETPEIQETMAPNVGQSPEHDPHAQGASYPYA